MVRKSNPTTPPGLDPQSESGPAATEPTVRLREHADGRANRSTLLWFALTTLLGAFLVFQVQPVISKCVLPWFGGTPAVWTTCMLFFQVLLFGGYLYAHGLRRYLAPPAQGAIHLTLLAIAALSLPIEPSDAWKPTGTESPMVHLLSLLAVHVGFPYFVLSSTGPLVQAWLSYRDPSAGVYRLYALSNIGSLTALLSYPFLVEPLLPVATQSTVWSLTFCLFVLVQGWLAIGLLRVKTSGAHASHRAGAGGGEGSERAAEVKVCEPGRLPMAAWVLLPALASTMLLVVTNHVCQDVAVIPFLWILPLSLYLISFIVCFDSPQWYRPKLFAAVTLVAIVCIQSQAWIPSGFRLVVEAGCYFVMLAGVCLLCHGEVARLKPETSQLTWFYACVSAGGAIGGVLVAILCPLVFDSFVELPVGLAVVAALSFVLYFVCRSWSEVDYDWTIAKRLRVPALLMLAAPLLAVGLAPTDEIVASERNFFGVLQVARDEQGLRLVHGKTIHGIERPGEQASEPTSYYGRESGVGRVIAARQQDRPALRIGVVGLGCGVLATYGRPSDVFDMIEINPAVLDIAERHFQFLKRSPAEIHHHLGDGRLVLERMRGHRFDLLVLDAFSSDAIPAHLLTREAMSLYAERLAAGGVIAVHVSNNHLDLVPLVHRLAIDQGWESRVIRSTGDPALATKAANWVVLAEPEHSIWNAEPMGTALERDEAQLHDAPLWTDQRHDLLGVLKLWGGTDSP